MDIRRSVVKAPGDRWGPSPPHATFTRRRSVRLLRVFERGLLVLGVTLLGYYGYVSAEARLYQTFEQRELQAILTSAPAVSHDANRPPPARRLRPAAGSTIGRIEIPRLGVSTVIRAGTDSRTLNLAVGHISGTAFPGESGNIGLAGHRDTFFRRLRNIRPDDEIRLVTQEGTFAFRVLRTNIVDPRDTWVLDPTTEPMLTLVTCYPFTYIGSAPQRFIVRATAVDSGRAATRM
jgi:sortase A